MRHFVYLLFLVFLTSISFGQTQRQKDSLVLVAIYNATNGASWTNASNWLKNGQKIDTWWGVTVENDRVTELRLQHNNLSGTLPSQLSNLSALKTIYLGYNSGLTGQLPDLSNLSSLEVLSLSNSGLSGDFPSFVAHLTNLTVLDFEDVNFSGQIPNLSALTNLTSLKLSNVSFPDNKIPQYFNNFKKLKTLFLANCNLRDSVPDFLAKNGITSLNVANNNLSYLPKFDKGTMNYLKVINNYFDFGDLEYNKDAMAQPTQFYYNPQKPYGTEVSVFLKNGETYTMHQDAGGSSSHYQWYKGTSSINGANTQNYTIVSFSASDVGEYYCEATNDIITGITLKSKKINISSTGQILNINVYNAVNNQSIEGAEVSVAGQTAVSNSSGQASFAIPGGTYNLNVTAQNYSPYSTSLTLGNDGASVNFSVKLNPLVSVLKKNIAKTLAFYPNPSDGMITIVGAKIGSKLEIFDLNGKKILQKDIMQKNVYLNLDKGFYILKISNSEGIYSAKLIIK
jgi:Leucine-rich repeat (LRR) protein